MTYPRVQTAPSASRWSSFLQPERDGSRNAAHAVVADLDLRTMLPPPETLRCSLNEREMYEVKFEVLARRGPDGNTTRMEVRRSTDGGKNWSPVRLRRIWRRQWWQIIKDGLGGSSWPPAGEDVNAVYVKDGKFTIAYWNLYEFGPKGQAYSWEMQYDPAIDRWNLELLEEIWDMGVG